MRDYKGTGNMTFRRRRRQAPWGLIILIAILAATVVAGYLVWDRTDLFRSTSALVKPERERGVIPLAIPGQAAPSETDAAD